MRVTQRQMFSTYTSQMGNSLSGLMESNNQGGSGKRINRPSDDPAGMGRVLLSRQTLSEITRYKTNIGEASGWLNQADYSLMQVSDVITKIKTLDLQGSTGTYDGENRDQISSHLRGYLGELLNLANTEYNGQHIFAGHKTTDPAFYEGLGVTTNNNDLEGVDFEVHGGSDYSVIFQFVEDGAIDDPTPPRYIYSLDGGSTWRDDGGWSTDADGNPMMETNGKVSVVMRLQDPSGTWPTVTGVTPSVPGSVPGIDDPNDLHGAKASQGTWLYVRPAVFYQGDDHDTQVTQQYGASNFGPGDITADGFFSRDVAVRIDSVDPIGTPPDMVKYSYSLDNGSTWVQGSVPNTVKQLPVHGGFLTVDSTLDFTAGEQFLIHPHRADIDIEISANSTITVNMVGKDIFGGLYKEPFADYAKPVKIGANGVYDNLFEIVGDLIAMAESNDQEGFGEGLDRLTEAQKLVTTRLAEVGARENRLEVAFETVSIREMTEEDARSSIEDVDTITLMTKLAQQQLAYNTVLKSASMIMQMSLMNFI